MEETQLIAVMTVFVVIAAVALCIQAAMLIGMYKTTKSLQQQVTSVLPQVRSVLAKTEATIDENRRNIVQLTAKANEIAAKAHEITERMSDVVAKSGDLLDQGKVQMAKVDVLITDASDRARVQLEKAEMVVDDTMSRVHHTVTSVHNGVLKPVREIQAVAAGLRAAVQHLVRGGRPSVADATHDDEMFIG